MTARLTEREFMVSADAMFIVRQGLCITKYHLDPALVENVYALCGVELEDFARLLPSPESCRQEERVRR